MRILALADVHGCMSHIDAIKERAGPVDLVVISGDLTNFGPVENAEKLMSMFDGPVLAVPGNCDPVEVLKILGDANLHRAIRVVDDITFVGIGGSNPTPFCTPFELSEEEIGDSLEELFSNVEGTVVLISHAPPFGLLDEVSGEHVGCHAVAQFIDRCKLVICAHIHEARGFARRGDTLLVNPGMAAQGFGALIEIESDNINLSFIEV